MNRSKFFIVSGETMLTRFPVFQISAPNFGRVAYVVDLRVAYVVDLRENLKVVKPYCTRCTHKRFSEFTVNLFY
jgi:hypothetical protein